MIRDATRAFSLPMIEEDNVEADDMIASYAKAACAAGWHVTIVSSDKDLMQLVDPCVDMFDTMKNERIRAEEVIEKFGVGPEKVGDVLALMGDSVGQCARRPRRRPEDRDQADSGIRRSGKRAGCRARHETIEDAR